MKKKSSTAQTPQQPIRLPPRNSKWLWNVTNLGATKSWLRTTRRCNISDQQLRWPQLHHLEDKSDEWPYRYASTYLCDYVVDVSTSRILPSTNAKIPSKFAPISSQIDTGPPRCFTIPLKLTGTASPAFVAYRVNQSKDGNRNGYQYTLTKYECSTIDPFDVKADKKSMIFTSLVKFGEVYFGLSLQGALAVMQEIDGTRLAITAISSSRGVPSVSCRCFKEYLVELNGEVLLVFLIHRKSIGVVDEVEVFRLGFPDLKWVKVEGLQGKALFLDQHRLEVVNSVENGRCRGDCVYFTHGSDNRWWVYDMGNACILPA